MAAVFRDSHKAPPSKGHCKPIGRLEFLRFPQIHSDHHNNKPYKFFKFLKSLAVLIVASSDSSGEGKQEGKPGKASFPTYFHSTRGHSGLYTLLKSE